MRWSLGVWLAVDALLVKPIVGGEKYMPAKIASGTWLSEEQDALCKRGRWLQDKVNAVFSVAHSQTLHSSADLPEVEQIDLPLEGEQAQPTAPATTPVPPPDSDEKTPQ